MMQRSVVAVAEAVYLLQPCLPVRTVAWWCTCYGMNILVAANSLMPDTAPSESGITAVPAQQHITMMVWRW
jgi:hypothetical protein